MEQSPSGNHPIWDFGQDLPDQGLARSHELASEIQERADPVMGGVEQMATHRSESQHKDTGSRPRGDSIIGKSPTRQVGDKIVASVPGPVPIIPAWTKKES
jgi:hypothetical protein